MSSKGTRRSNASVTGKSIMSQTTGGGRGGYWDIYRVQSEPESNRSGQRTQTKYNIAANGRKAGPPKKATRKNTRNNTSSSDSNKVYCPITGDLMYDHGGHPTLLAKDAPEFLNRAGFSNNSKTKIDPITGENLVERQAYLEMFKPGGKLAEEAKVNTQWNPDVAVKGYGAAFIGRNNEHAERVEKNFQLFLDQGGKLRADVDIEKIRGRRQENVITWRQQYSSRLPTPSEEELSSQSGLGDSQIIKRVMQMDGVLQDKGSFNGVRTKVGGWPSLDDPHSSAVLKAARDEREYQPPVKDVAITKRTKESDAAVRSAREDRLRREEENLKSKPNMRTKNQSFQVPRGM